MTSLPSNPGSAKELRNFLRKAWTLVDGRGLGEGGIGTSNAPGSSSRTVKDSRLSANSLARDRLERYRSKLSTYQPLLSAVVGEPDFLPISFLDSGLGRGQAVCRIVINYSIDELQAIIDRLKSYTKLHEAALFEFQERNVLSAVDELKAIFSLQNDFFRKLICDHKKPSNEITFTEALDVLQDQKFAALLSLNPFALGTGFLVGETHLLTNHHVLPTVEIAQQCVAQFGYEDRAGVSNISEFDFDPQLFFVTNPDLDYTLVQLKPDPYSKRMAGYQFDWLDLVELEKNAAAPLTPLQIQELEGALKKLNYDDKQIEGFKSFIHDKSRWKGDRTTIIEHPRGRKKEIVLNNNVITRKTFYNLEYETDTDYGSSGSPVFNLDWRLIAITKEVVPEIESLTPTKKAASGTDVKQAEDARSNAPAEKNETLWRRFIASKGTRIIRVIEDLKKQSVGDSRLQTFIENFVTTSENLNYPPLPAALEFDGISNYIDVSQSPKEAKNQIDDSPQFSIEAWVNPSLSGTNSTIFSQVCTEPWYQDLQEDAIFGRYLLSLQVTPEGKVVFCREPFWQVSSKNFPSNGLLYPWINTGTGRKPSLDVLLKTQEGDQSVTQEAITIKIDRNSEKIQALRSILYCLGFFHADEDNEELPKKPPEELPLKVYKQQYLDIVNAELDEKTKTKLDEKTEMAIKAFNEWSYLEADIKKDLRKNLENFFATSDLPKDKLLIQIKDGNITISSEAITLFTGRGALLGVGTKRGSDPNTSTFKDHHGLRVLELQHCLKGLDWQHNPFLYDQTLCKAPDVPLTGRYDWSPNSKPYKPETWLPSTTEYAVKKLQSLYYQRLDGIFGRSALAALEQAKSYSITTREKLPIGEYSHVAVTFEDAEVKIYINGQLANRRYAGEQSLGQVEKAVIGARVGDQSADSQPTYTDCFTGRLAEVRVWRASLKPQDIAKRMYRRLNCSEIHDENLVGYWQLEEGRIEARDQVSQAAPEKQSLYHVYNLGQSSPYATKSALNSKKVNMRGNLRSARDFPTVPLPFGLKIAQKLELNPPLNDSASQNDDAIRDKQGITIEIWLKLEYGEGKIISGGDSQTGQYSLSWKNGKIQLKLERIHQKAEIETQAAVPSTLNWHHIAFSWNARSNEVNLYLDGKPQNVVALQANVKQGNDKSIVTFQPQNFTPDRQSITVLPEVTPDQVQNLECSLADLRVWKIVRSPSEIKASLNQRLDPTKEAGLVNYYRFNGTDKQFDSNEVFSDQQSGSKAIAWVAPQSKVLEVISDKHWAARFINGLHEIGLLGSLLKDSTTPFLPDESMSKIEFSRLQINAFGGAPNSRRARVRLQLKDDEIQSEDRADIEYVWKLGLISGEVEQDSRSKKNQSPNNSKYEPPVMEIGFAPKQPYQGITRGQVFDAIFDSLRDKAPRIVDSIQSQNQKYRWIPLEKISAGLQNQLIVSRFADSDHLNFEEVATRAEIAAMIYQALTLKNEVPKIESNHIMRAADIESIG